MGEEKTNKERKLGEILRRHLVGDEFFHTQNSWKSHI